MTRQPFEPADDGAAIAGLRRPADRVVDVAIDSPALAAGTSVRLLLPPRFGQRPCRPVPLLYLLHGANDDRTYRCWTESTDVEELTRPTELLVAMPEGGTDGYYSDWWNAGRGGPPAWESYHLVELRQLLERNFRAAPERLAIAGLSMGGFGAMSYAARHPGMFRAAAAYSGVLDTRTNVWPNARLWGDRERQADVWRAHNPYDLAANLRGTSLYVSWGDGRPGPLDEPGAGPDGVEARLAPMSRSFVDRLGELEIPATIDGYGAGTHSWPYWQRALHASLPQLLSALGEPR